MARKSRRARRSRTFCKHLQCVVRDNNEPPCRKHHATQGPWLAQRPPTIFARRPTTISGRRSFRKWAPSSHTHLDLEVVATISKSNKVTHTNACKMLPSYNGRAHRASHVEPMANIIVQQGSGCISLPRVARLPLHHLDLQQACISALW